jgi:hypothetical protein
MRLYAAYGSNLHTQQMKKRCPDAEMMAKGFINDYELEFRGVATIKPSPGKKVPVVLWGISKWDEKALDRYEGVALGCYRKKTLKVAIQHWEIQNDLDEFKEIEAMVYILNTDSKPAPPSKNYYKTIHEGYLQNCLELSYLETALSLSGAKIKNYV